MKIIDFVVELHGNKEVTINGRALQHKDAAMVVQEDIIFKQLQPEQQWIVICEVMKRLMQLQHCYQKSRVKAKEITMDDYDKSRKITSGAKGIPGTGIGPLGRKGK